MAEGRGELKRACLKFQVSSSKFRIPGLGLLGPATCNLKPSTCNLCPVPGAMSSLFGEFNVGRVG